MSLWSRIGNVLRGDRLRREIDEELESHISEAIERGQSPPEAHKALGSRLRLREESLDLKVVVWLDAVRADVIFGWRQLNKNRVSSAAAVLSLALAIGACTSAFRLIDALLLRPLPVANSERLYSIAQRGLGPGGDFRISESSEYPLFRLMRDAVKDSADLIAVSYADRVDVTYGSDEQMEKANRQYVSGSMFQQFGLQPAAGRLLTGRDDQTPGAHPYAVISHNYWKRRFGQDPRVVGRNVRIDNTPLPDCWSIRRALHGHRNRRCRRPLRSGDDESLCHPFRRELVPAIGRIEARRSGGTCARATAGHLASFSGRTRERVHQPIQAVH